MGTRHRQAVISGAGDLKIQQYGQWDGYPAGQGVQILEYLRFGDLDKYHKNLSKIPEITGEQAIEVDKDKDWELNYPYLSRNCGSAIHQIVEDGKVKFVSHIDEEEANKWCEGFYTIDFSKNEFTSEHGGNRSVFKLDNLPSNEEYLSIMEVEN